VARRPGAGGHQGGGGGHDGAGSMRWLLTYADLITLLMVFFIVLYSISQVNQQKYIALSNALRASFLLSHDSGNAALTTSPTPSLDAHNLPQTDSQDGILRAVGQQVLDQARRLNLQADVSVRVTPEGLRISFEAQSVFFAKADATIRPAFQSLLLAVAPLLRPLPNQIEVQGYTDNEPLYSPIYATSWELSAARAVNVLRFLVDKGGLDPGKVSAVAFGEYHPLYSNATPQGQAMNRSVDLLVRRLAQPAAPGAGTSPLQPPTAGAGQ
jgi:chemotaxis protein MotB